MQQSRLSYRSGYSSIYDHYTEYNFLYTLNSIHPNSYTTSFVEAASPLPTGFSFTMKDTLIYNVQNKIAIDSTIFCTVASSGSIIAQYYDYGNNLIVKKTYYKNSPTSNSIDSIFLDDNENQIKYVFFKFDSNNIFTLKGITISKYGNLLDPFYNYPAIVRGKSSKNMPLSVTATYIEPTTTHVDQYVYQYSIDINGLLSKATVIIGNTNSANTFAAAFNYY